MWLIRCGIKKTQVLFDVPAKNWTISSLLQPKGRPRSLTRPSPAVSGLLGPVCFKTQSISTLLDLKTETIHKSLSPWSDHSYRIFPLRFPNHHLLHNDVPWFLGPSSQQSSDHPHSPTPQTPLRLAVLPSCRWSVCWCCCLRFYILPYRQNKTSKSSSEWDLN